MRKKRKPWIGSRGESSGSICICTSDDRAALTQLYRSVFPLATDYEAPNEFGNEGELPPWIAYKNEREEIRIAMLLASNGTIAVFADPANTESVDLKHGFVRLCETAVQLLKSRGVTGFAMTFPASLKSFSRALNRGGLLGEEVLTVRALNVATVCPELVINGAQLVNTIPRWLQ